MIFFNSKYYSYIAHNNNHIDILNIVEVQIKKFFNKKERI